MLKFKSKVINIINWVEDKYGVGESSNDIIVEEIKKELGLFIPINITIKKPKRRVL